MNNGVFLPIEITKREYISKLLLSIELIKKGMPVIIGHKSQVIKLALKTKEPGIFFNKGTMAGGLEKTFEELKKQKFGFVAQDEEAGVIFDNFEDFYIDRPSLESVYKLDQFFTWGEEEYNFLIQKFGDKIVNNSGGLRSCFWGDLGKEFYKIKSQNLKKKYGNYILIVSNLATYNSFLGKQKDLELESKREFFDLEEYNMLYEREKKTFFQYKDLIELITNEMKKKVIIRPHPSEGLDLWKDAVKGLNNVFVEKEGDLLSWILASDFIIQNNCTSAIEASAVDIPVVTYLNKINERTLLSKGNENIPNKISINIFGKKSFVETANNIKTIWNKNENKIRRKILLNRKLTDYGTTKGAEKIAQKIIELSGTPNIKGYENIGKDSFIYDIFELFRNFKKKSKRTSNIMDLNKRETLSISRIQKDIAKLKDIMKVNIKINVKRVRPSTFYLSPSEVNSGK